MHIFKAVATYLRRGDGATPESTGEKADHFVGRFYAGYAADPALAHGPCGPPELMRQWVQGSQEVRDVTRRLASWAEAGFDATFDDWRVRFDDRFYETQEQAYIDVFLAEQARAGRVHPDAAGRLVVDVGDDGSTVLLTRSDGSPLYMSHMVAAILQRMDVLGPDVQTLMALTGDDQVVPFQQLGAVLDAFGYATNVEVSHVTHGLVRAEGKDLSSRDGTPLTLDHVVADLSADLVGRQGDDADGAQRARAVLALYLLSRSMDKPIDFSRGECLRVGTGIFSDLSATLEATSRGHAGRRAGTGADPARLERWLMKLASYPVVLDRAVTRLDPTVLLKHVADLCHDFVSLNRTGQVAEPLLPPTRHVVQHALGVLNLPFDGPGPALDDDPLVCPKPSRTHRVTVGVE